MSHCHKFIGSISFWQKKVVVVVVVDMVLPTGGTTYLVYFQVYLVSRVLTRLLFQLSSATFFFPFLIYLICHYFSRCFLIFKILATLCPFFGVLSQVKLICS